LRLIEVRNRWFQNRRYPQLALVKSRAPLAVRDVSHAVTQVDPAEAVANFSPMVKLVAESVAASRFVAILVIIFAGLAVLLDAIGLYGVLACSVAGRIHEIGLRMARERDALGCASNGSWRRCEDAFLGFTIGLLAALDSRVF
jgi:hypothetical protein